MDRGARYAVAPLVAAAVTGGLAVEYDSPSLLAGIFGVYAAAVALGLRFPGLWRGNAEWDRAPSGVLTGVATLGAYSLALGVGDGFHLGAGVLGIGLVAFGAAAGLWLADSAEG